MPMKYTKESLEPIVQSARSFRELLRLLELTDSGGNNSYIRKVVKCLDLDTSHFNGQAWSKGKSFPPKYPIEDYLSNKRRIHSARLKNRLFKEGFFEKKCYLCGLTHWRNEPAPLELHHIDHNHENNNLDNLTILCANCHAITHSLARDCHTSPKQKRKKERKPRQSRLKYKCNSCGKDTSNPKFCSYECMHKHQRVVDRPDYDTLKKELEESNYSAVGRKYGVTDNAIRKWIRSYEKG